MADEVTFTRDGLQYRVMGLEAKAASITSGSSELDTLIAGRLTAAQTALAEWRGPHALTFVDQVNIVLAKMASQKIELWSAANIVASFPDTPQASLGSVHYQDSIYMGARVEVPVAPGTASAKPSALRSYVTTATGQDDRFWTLAGVVNLNGVAAEVTYNRPLTPAERQRAIDRGEDPATVDRAMTPQTDPVDPAALITLPDPVTDVPALTDASSVLNDFTLAVATAFETGDQALLDRLAKDPNALRVQLDWLRGDPRRWNQLSATEQRFLIDVFPAEIGAMNGLPTVVRDRANRIVLGRSKAALAARLDEVRRLTEPPPPPSEYGHDPYYLQLLEERKQLEEKLDGIRIIEERLAQTGRPQAFLMGFSADGNGRAIIAIGNPDSAANVATYVPGTGSRLGNIGGDLSRTDAMYSDANYLDPSHPTSVIMWVGYDAPQSLPSASREHYAVDGAPLLRDFQNGLDISHVSGGANKTVIGHSYGSTVIGHAARYDGELNTDSVVFLGSPGVGVNHVAALNLDRDHVFASTAKNDVIRLVPVHGTSPVSDSFDAQVFTSADGDSGWWFGKSGAAHSQYWDDGNVARDNMAAIVTGHHDLVQKPPPGPPPVPHTPSGPGVEPTPQYPSPPPPPPPTSTTQPPPAPAPTPPPAPAPTR